MARSQNPTDVAKRWADSLSASGAKIRDGVNAVTESPTAKAALAVDRWVAGVQRARDDGSYVSGLNNVSLASWKQSMLDKGVNRISSGATAAIPKMTQFLTGFLPYVQSGVDQLTSMPRGDLSQNISRMVHMTQYLAKYKS